MTQHFFFFLFFSISQKAVSDEQYLNDLVEEYLKIIESTKVILVLDLSKKQKLINHIGCIKCSS